MPLALWTFGLIFSVLIPRLAVFAYGTIDWDEIVYALVGREIVWGHWPYSTAFDHKPAALYYVFALAFLVFDPSIFAIRVLGLGFAAASYALVYACARRLGASAVLAAAAATAYGFASLGVGNLATNTEIVVNTYLLVAAYALLRPPGLPAALGFVAALVLAINTNYVFAPIVGVSAVQFLWGYRQRPRTVVAAAAMAVLVQSLLLLPILLWADLGEHFRLQFAYLLAYQESPGFLITLTKFGTFLAPWVPMIVAAALLPRPSSAEDRRLDAWLWVHLIAALMAACASLRFYAHYALLLAPALCLLLALRLSARTRGAYGYVAIIAGIVLTLVVPRLEFIVRGLHGVIDQGRLEVVASDPYRRMAELLQADLRPGDTIYVRDYAIAVYLMTGARLPSRFFFPEHHRHPQKAAALGFTPETEMQAIMAQRPRFLLIADGPGNLGSAMTDYLRQHCRPRENISGTNILRCD